MGRRSFAFTEDVPFIEIEIVDNFGELDGFVDALNDFANRPEFKGKKILPIVCTRILVITMFHDRVITMLDRKSTRLNSSH